MRPFTQCFLFFNGELYDFMAVARACSFHLFLAIITEEGIFPTTLVPDRAERLVLLICETCARNMYPEVAHVALEAELARVDKSAATLPGLHRHLLGHDHHRLIGRRK